MLFKHYFNMVQKILIPIGKYPKIRIIALIPIKFV